MRLGVFFLLLMACSSEHPPPTAHITQPIIACVGYDASLPPQSVDLDAGSDAAVYAPFMSGMCPTPPSVCVDSEWTAYFDDARCVENRCVWDVKLFRCTDGCLDMGQGAYCKADRSRVTPPAPTRN